MSTPLLFSIVLGTALVVAFRFIYQNIIKDDKHRLQALNKACKEAKTLKFTNIYLDKETRENTFDIQFELLINPELLPISFVEYKKSTRSDSLQSRIRFGIYYKAYISQMHLKNHTYFILEGIDVSPRADNYAEAVKEVCAKKIGRVENIEFFFH